MSLYSLRQSYSCDVQRPVNAGICGVPQWSSAMNVGKAIKDFYESKGDVTLTGANTISTIPDGPEKVVRYGNLTIGDGTTATTLTASQRCKGLTIICDSLTVRNNATLHMTGRGARVMTNDDQFFPFIDFRIPNQITLSSDRVTLSTALAMIKANGWALWDQGTFQSIVAALAGFDLAVSQAGTVTLLSVAGCGAGGTRSYGSGAGGNGSAGINGGMGGGGTGALYADQGWAICAKGGDGCLYSGGSGSGGVTNHSALGWGVSNTGCGPMTRYSGPGGGGGGHWNTQPPRVGETGPNGIGGGGGAGNPGGSSFQHFTAASDGCGGKLVIVCYGAVTVQNGGKIEANGMQGGGGSSAAGGGGSGGGHISIITSSAYTNSGTVQAAGGAGGVNASYNHGGNGGTGSVVTKTFNDMGWS